MNVLRGALGLAVVLGLQALIGRVAPTVNLAGDIMLVPVAWYGIRRSQRSAMVVGCVGGLLQDAWFQAGVFGLNGFKKTLLGWALGGIGARLDLNNLPGRWTTGALLSIGDQLLELGLYRLLDLRAVPLNLLQMSLRAVVVGFLVVLTFSVVDRFAGRGDLRPSVRGGV